MLDKQIDQQVDIHDGTQFEIRLDYAQDLAKNKNCYRVESYLFFPKSLRIDQHHYTKETFYQDLKTNIRLQTPRVALSKLMDSENGASLQSLLKEPLNRLLSGNRTSADISAIEYELKLFASIFRSQVNAQVKNLLSLVTHLEGDPSKYPTIVKDIQKLLKLFVKDITTTLTAFRKLRATFLTPAIPAKLVILFEEINEFLSLTTEIYLAKFIVRSNFHDPVHLLGNSYIKALQLIERESAYRTGANYLSCNPLLDDGEKFIYRNSELKKTVMEVLFLKPKVGKDGGHIGQLVAMFAAGLAMTWALAMLVFGQIALIQNSMPFLFLMVISYIIKDRMKDSIKNVLAQRLISRFFHDRKVVIHNSKNQKVGQVQETVMFIDKNQIPEDVISARYPAHSGKRFETIIKHDRVVTLFTGKFEPNRSSVINVTRLCISSFLSKMDDSVVSMPCYAEQQVSQIPMAKVYHIHLILRLLPCCKGGSAQPILRHFRIVLDRKGIKRLETLDQNSALAEVHYSSGIVGNSPNDSLTRIEEDEISIS